ncbi:6-bladed beta-propeller [Parabacteroides pacaensis]|uniref:6-bladed beta-propeller n=1 Tax=Parabacteroides pacaensis TaxID=2086575 RepID=UPI000D10F545|nr:6-bladed beta-propeller [Parabacteroides pacaensis]
MKKLISFLIILGVFSSCSFKKTDEGKIHPSKVEIIKVNPNNSDSINLSSLISVIEVVPLETNTTSLLAEIAKLEIDDNQYFILNSQDKLVYVYDEDGKFCRVIGSRGNGPGELQFPKCFSLLKKDKEVWIVDNFSSFSKYDYKGNFKEKIDFHLFFSDFIILDKENLCFHASKLHNYINEKEPSCWNLWMKDSKSEKLKTYFPFSSSIYPNGGMYFDTKTPFNIHKDTILYHYAFSDTIYQINKSKVLPRYLIDFGTYKSKVDLGNLPGKEALNYMTTQKNEAFYIQDVLEGNSFIKFKYLMNSKMWDAFFFKEKQLVINGIVKNDILGATIKFIKTSGNKLIGYIEPHEIIITNKTASFLPEKTIQLLQEVKKDSNPILIICEIK